MAQIFRKSANNIAKISLMSVVLLAGVGFYAWTQLARSSYLTGQYLEIQQPVQFSHKHHVGDDGIDCRYCHQTVETTASAGMPSTQTCMNCHSQLWADAPYLEPIRASFRDLLAVGDACAQDGSQRESRDAPMRTRVTWVAVCHRDPPWPGPVAGWNAS